MIKKKLNILLLLSQVLLFTSLLGTTCYAKTLSEQEIRNLFINFYKTKINSEIPSNILNNINSADFSSWSSFTSAYEGKYIISAERPNNNNSYLGMTIWFYVANGKRAYRYNQNGMYVVNSTDSTKWSQSYYVTNNTFTTWSQSANMSYIWNTNYFWYTDTDIYAASTGNDIHTLRGTYSPNEYIFYENMTPPVTEHFGYAPSSLIPEIDLNNSFYFSETAQEILFVYNPFSRKRSKHC